MEHISTLAQKTQPLKKTAKKTRQRRSVAHKLRSVRRVLGGLSTVAVGRKYGDSQRAVADWVQRFKKHGVKGLEEAPRSGRPSTINSAQMKTLKAFATKAHARSEDVSGRAVADFLKENFGIALTRQQGRRILNRLNS